jgi:hypothetical protein
MRCRLSNAGSLTLCLAPAPAPGAFTFGKEQEHEQEKVVRVARCRYFAARGVLLVSWFLLFLFLFLLIPEDEED